MPSVRIPDYLWPKDGFVEVVGGSNESPHWAEGRRTNFETLNLGTG
jgi:hypothetical protein